VSILNKIGNVLLQQKLKRRTRTKVMCDMDGAKTVGMLFTADSIDSYNRIIQFANKLVEEREIKVLSIGFVENKKHFDLYTEQPGFRFFSAKQCNWYGKPKDHAVEFFIEKEFDILLDLNLKDNVTLDFIAGMSKAKFKVGRQKNNTRIYDMMIDPQKENTLDYFITQVELYLSMFKVEHNKEA
jgi:hypothetical protein